MLIGEYAHSLDDKGRITIPVRFREDLGQHFLLTVGLDGCLACYSSAEWSRLTERLKTLPMTNRDARAFVRLLLAGATEVDLDRQGRILIAPRLRLAAGIETEAVLVGLNTRVEIWAASRWQQYQSAAQDGFEAAAENLVDLGL
jgi:MraZ protein